ncbi:type ISP restriction/modification enzyme [Actinocorallia lasiicapitis]
MGDRSLGLRFDYVVNVAGALVGHVELKRPGKGVPPNWHGDTKDREQWEKLSRLPNVLYSDGNHWAVYHYGKPRCTGSLAGDVRSAGSRLAPGDGTFVQVVSAFLLWKPPSPRGINELVRATANLCRLLRDEVAEGLRLENEGASREEIFAGLAGDWRMLLFPDLTDTEFADAYAQTVTFALLLARLDGIDFEQHSLAEIAKQLGKRHGLMGKALALLTEKTFESRSVTVTTMLRVIGAVDWTDPAFSGPDLYARLYEGFLAIYDPELRKRSGSYYTPPEVARFMVAFVDELLREKLGKPRGLATRDVTIIDPAMGTGTFLTEIVHSVARTIADVEGEPAVPAQLRSLFGRLMGFEKQTGPYAVAALGLHQTLKVGYGTELPEQELDLLVADTLDHPGPDSVRLPQAVEPVARSRRRAGQIKRDVRTVVAIGNPPYGNNAGGRGGWIEKGDLSRGEEPPLNAFRADENGRYEYVLSNLYVYFWRWATWKVFDAHDDSAEGIVAFISPASFLTGRGHAGMRDYLRRTTDEGWIIDLSPEQHQPDVSSRIFRGVQHPLCIAFFIRTGKPHREELGQVHHLSVTGGRTDKMTRLQSITLTDPDWSDCTDADAQAPLLPSGSSDWLSYPPLGDLMPWFLSGMKPNRNWVHAPDIETLRHRWRRLIRSSEFQKPHLMKETGDRNLTKIPPALPGTAHHTVPLIGETSFDPKIEEVALRSFDRQHVIYDARVLDRPRPPLWDVRGPAQIFVTEQHAHPIDAGPGLTFASLVPSMHHFNGRGGRVLPLYRDSSALSPNIAPGLLRLLSERVPVDVGPRDLLAYVAATVAHDGYTKRLADELRTPGIRVPISADPAVWTESVTIGHQILALHTYGAWTRTPSANGSTVPCPSGARRPRVVSPIPDTADEMPDVISYDPGALTLHVGSGAISPVPPEVWAYEVAGWRVVKKWFDYRKKRPGGKRTSPLDDIFASAWTADTTSELLELLGVLILVVDLEPRQADLLDRICAGPLITTADLTSTLVLPVPPRVRKSGRIAPPGSQPLPLTAL